MMATRKLATVIGGSGFIGRYVVKRLAAAGYVVRVAVRDPAAAAFLRPMGAVGQIVPLFTSLTQPATVRRAVEGADCVVNLVGILAESRPGDFDRLQAQGAGLVAKLASECHVARLVQVSAIGADPASQSLYASSKGRGEAAVRAAFPTAIILRPSLVFGAEDGFFNRFGKMAALLPVMPLFFGDTRFQPVYVADVADAVMAALTLPHPAPLYELGGPDILTFRELIRYILEVTKRPRRVIEIPKRIAEWQAAVCERLPGKPLTRDQLILLQRDNVASADLPGLTSLGVTPTPIEIVVPAYLKQYRPGGGNKELLTA
jgi:NADH dehydrogenase